MPVCWAILKDAIDAVYSSGEQTGDFVYMKDPNKAVIKLYKKTADEVNEDEEDEEL